MIKRSGRSVFVHTVQGRLVAAGHRSRYPERYPKRTPDHRCRMLVNRPQNWNHLHWSHAIFDEESRVSLYHSDSRSIEFQLFHGCNNPLAFKNMTKNSGMTITVVDADLLANNIWDQCGWFQFCCLCANTWCRQRRWSVISVGHQFGYLEWYPAKVLGPCRKKQGVLFACSTPPWSRTLRENSFLSWNNEGCRLPWCDRIQ